MSQEVAALRAEIERLEKWVAELQTGCYVNCGYCGFQYGRRDDVSGDVPMADALKQHIATCPRHPMSRLLGCCRATRDALKHLLAERDGLSDQFLAGLLAEVRAAIAAAEV